MRRLAVVPSSVLVLMMSCSGAAVSEKTTSSVATTAISTTADVSRSMALVPSTTTTTTTTTIPTISTTSTTMATTTTDPPRNCTPVEPPTFHLPDADPAPATVELSEMVYPCAVEVGVAPADEPAAAATLAATGIDGPLLLVGEGFDSDVMGELGRLAPEKVVAAGFDEDELAPLSDFEVSVLEVDGDASPLPDPGAYQRIWMVAPGELVAPLAVIAADLGIGLIVAEPDFRALPASTRNLISEADRIDLLTEWDEEVAWQLEVVRKGDEIPGGGQVMFDGDVMRRLVAFYGHPSTSRLGVLGEQNPERGILRLSEVAADYAADGATILPTFEIIATVASAGPGRDGDYSAETDREVIRPWIESASENDIYVVLDLQPGRTDFLTQAKIYEEFLRLPHVGLALDPEWRLKPNQVHLQQIGTVDASEVNQVVRWLAGVVREEALPQKLLIVHQFRFSMITNRELIETPAELAVVIQMDGQGGLGAKYNTWGTLTRGTEDLGFRWGWKNFYDEDFPTPTPAQVLDLTPVPVFVSYQ